VRSFAANADNLPAGLPPHNEVLSPDTMTTLFINHQWRRLISDSLQSYADSIILKLDDSLVDDYRNQFQALLDDLYTDDIVISPPASITMYRNSNQSIAANTPTAISWNETINAEGLTLWSSGTPTKFIIPADGGGFYTINGTVQFPATGASQVKSARIVLNGLTVWMGQINILNSAQVGIAWGLELVEDDEIEIEVLCAVAITLGGNANGAVSIALIRIPQQL